MSALSDVENLRLHDIADGDVRDDPRWLALMGEGAMKALLQEMAAKHLVGRHNQDSHGNDHGGIDVPNPLDKLKLGKRAPAGFTVRSSKKIKTDYADVGIAEVDSPDGPQVRVGVIGNESGKWDAGFVGEARKAQLRQEIDRKQALMDSDDDDVDDDIEDQISELQSELEDLEGERTAIVSPQQMADFRRQLDEALTVAKANKDKVDADAKAQDVIDEKRAAIIAEHSDAEMERRIHELSWRLRQAQGIVRDLGNDLTSGRSRHGWDPEFTAERLASWKEKVAKYEAELAPLLARRAELMPPDARARLEDLDRQFNALNDVAIDDMLTAAEVSAPNGARIRAEIWGSDDEDEQWVSTRLYVLTPGETSDDIDDDYGSFRGMKGLNKLIAGMAESSGDQPKSVAARRIRRKHLPGQHPQESHGNDHGVDVIPGDKLRGAGRIDLAPGERLLRSDRMRGDNGRAWLAVTEKDGKRSLRIGLGNANFGTRSDGNGPWRAAQDRSYEINEEREELRARREELENEIEALEGDAGANPAAIAERRAKLEELENADVDEVFPNGHTAILDEQSAKRLRETLAKALDDGEAMQNGFDERDDRIDELEKRRNELRKIVERVFTDEEDAEWDRLTAEIEAIEAQEPPRPAQGFWTLAEGSIPGQWANVHYEVYLDDPTIGVETRLGAIPHHQDQDFDELVNDNAHAQFAMSEADEFVKLLAKMSADLPKSSRRDTQGKHLPERHDQSSHGRGRRRAATAVLDVPDVPKPEPVAEPKPPKPRRAPKPKPKPKPKPPQASPEPVRPARRSDAEIDREIKEIAREMRDVESRARGPLATLARLDKKAADRGLRPADIDAYAAAEAEMQQLVREGVFLANTHLDLLVERDGQPFGGDAPGMPTARPRTSWVGGANQDAARRARSEYVMNDKLTIASNASLRSGNPTPEARKWRARMAQMTQSQRIDNDSVVYRGAVFKPDTIMKLQPGSVLHDVGTTSTDTSRENAKFYGDRRGLKRPGLLPTLFAIKIPAGTHGYDADADEFVFGPDSSMRILSSRRTDQGIEVTAEMLAPGQG